MFPPSFEFDREFHGHEDDVRAICANSEGQNQFATTSRDKTVRIWYLNGVEEADVNECKVFRGHSSFVTCIFWAPQGCLNIDEEVLISGSRDHRILVWSVSKGIVIEELNEHTMDITSIVVLMNGDIITASQDSQICIWRQFKLFKTLVGHKSSVLSLLAIPDKLEFYSGGADGTIRRWCKDYICTNVLHAHADSVRSLCLASNIGFLSASHDATAKLWSRQQNLKRTFIGHASLVYSVQFFQIDELNQFVITSGEDKTCKIWILSGECVQTIVHPGCVWSNLMLGKSLFTACSDNIVRKFDLGKNYRSSSEGSITTTISQNKLTGIAELAVREPIENINMQPGSFDGQVKVFTYNCGKSSAFTWKTLSQEWELIGEVIEHTEDIETGITSDYVFDIDVQDSAPPIKLFFNRGQNPRFVAEKFLQDNLLPASYKEKIIEFILQNVQENDISWDEKLGDILHPEQIFPTFIPTCTFVYFDKINLDGILLKLKEFGLAESKREILKESGIWNEKTAMIVQVFPVITELLSFRVEQLYPAFDLIRYAVLRPDCAAEIVKFSGELKATFLRAISPPATSQNVLTAFRLTNNCFGLTQLFETLVFSNLSQIFNNLVTLTSQHLKPALRITLCTFVMNFAVAVAGHLKEIENQNEIYKLFFDVLLQLYRNTPEDDGDSRFRITIALGNFIYNSNERRKLVSKEIHEYVRKCMVQTGNSKLQAAAMEAIAEISKG